MDLHFLFRYLYIAHVIAIPNSMRRLQNLDLASSKKINKTLGSYDKIMHIGVPVRNQ